MTKTSSAQRIVLLVIFLVAAVVFALISFVDHYNFRSYAFDLGLFNNAIYDFAHFRSNDVTMLYPDHYTFLQTHFSLFPILVSPLYWIFGSYTLLVFQLFSVLFGGWGVYRFIGEFTQNFTIRILGLLHFFTAWGIFSALAFDYHDNVVGAMFVPWIFYYFKKGQRLKVIIFMILLLISKENLALWAIFIFAGLAIIYRKEKIKRNLALICSAGSLAYFMLIILYVIPAFSPYSEAYTQFQMYRTLGGSFSEVLKNIFSHPLNTLRMLFENHSGSFYYDGIKMELHRMILLTGGFILLFRPAYFLMLIPLYLQKLLSDDPGRWGISSQYSIEFIPVLTCALFHFIGNLREKKWVIVFAILAVLLSLNSTNSVMEKRISPWYKPEMENFLIAEHYKNHFNVKAAYKILEKIPDDAAVSAQSMLVPHLAFREKIYQFPFVGDARYIVLIENDNPYPMHDDDYKATLDRYLKDPSWEILLRENSFLILKKK